MNPSGQENAGAVSSEAQGPDAHADVTVIAPPVSRRARFKAAAYKTLSRAAYWSPVLAALVLFAQVSFRGLRPSMAEARRLASAEVTLGERHDRAAAENHEVAAHLAARADPIFRERQRRLRVIEPPAGTPAQHDTSGTAQHDTESTVQNDANTAAPEAQSGAAVSDATKSAPPAAPKDGAHPGDGL